MRAFDNSMLDDFRRCMRYGYYRHVRGWQGTEPSPPLLFGSSWHAAMDVVWSLLCSANGHASHPHIVNRAFEAFMREWKAGGGPDPIPVARMKWWMPRVPQTARLMLEGYITKRAKALSKLTLVKAEEPFAVHLIGDIWYTGRRDKLVRDATGKHIIIEHKTTALGGKDGFQDKWKRGWSPKSQIDGYLYSAGLKYPRMNASLWIDGSLVHPEHNVFEFIPVSRASAHLDSWLWGVRYFASLVKQHWDAVRPEDGSRPFAKSEWMAAFPQSTGHCEQYNKLCVFHDVCKLRANPETMKDPPMGMTERFWDPLTPEEKEELTRER